MTIAHISDTHLGYRAYGRTTPAGFNLREADVMRTFRACLDAIAERDPDIVVHSGDLFHVVRPSNATITGTYQAIAAFQMNRGGKPFILIGGNHDSPRTSDSGNILKLFESIEGLHVRTMRAETVDLAEQNLEVLCVPNISLLSENISYLPIGGRKYSMLTLHGMASGVLRQARPEKVEFELEETHSDRWTYVALGDYHIHKPYGAHVCYAGSTDFASPNIWEEISSAKGWVWFDTGVGILEHVAVRTRDVIDLPVIDAANLSSDEIAEAMYANATWEDETLPIVRQRVLNLTYDTERRIEPSAKRELVARAMHYRFDAIRPTLGSGVDYSREVEDLSLERSWELQVDKALMTGGVTRESVRELGFNLLKEVAEIEDPTIEA